MRPFFVGSLFFLFLVAALPSCRTQPEVMVSSLEPHVDDGQRTPSVADDVLKFADYRKWHRVNDKPAEMSDVIASLCRIVDPGEEEAIRRTNPNPHQRKDERCTYTVFVNEVGKGRLLKGGVTPFPVGTILVKEKHKGSDANSSELLTVMVKREKGFAPDNGDWQYLVLDGFAKAIQKGDTTTCVKCHASVRENDFVYADYLPKK